MLTRFTIRRPRQKGSWEVVEVATGEIAIVGGVPQIGLSLEEAYAVADRLGRADAGPEIAARGAARAPAPPKRPGGKRP